MRQLHLFPTNPTSSHTAHCLHLLAAPHNFQLLRTGHGAQGGPSLSFLHPHIPPLFLQPTPTQALTLNSPPFFPTSRRDSNPLSFLLRCVTCDQLPSRLLLTIRDRSSRLINPPLSPLHLFQIYQNGGYVSLQQLLLPALPAKTPDLRPRRSGPSRPASRNASYRTSC